MKKLILILMFVVTWKTYEARQRKSQSTGIYFMPTYVTSQANDCELIEEEQQQSFGTEAEARRFAEETAKDRKNWDVKVWKMEEAK